MDELFSDSKRLGTALRESRRRADLSQRALGEMIGVSSKLVGRWEAGEDRSLGDTPQKRFAVAAQVAAATGDFTLVSERPEDDRLAVLEERLEQTNAALEQLAIRQLDADEEAEWRKYLPNAGRSEAPATGAANE